MTKKILLLIVNLYLMMIISSCSNIKLNNINSTNIAQVNFKSNFKVGQACSNTFLTFGPFGSSSIIDAARNGSLSKVEIVEENINNYILFQQICTVVHGK
jgi:hypothetical protein